MFIMVFVCFLFGGIVWKNVLKYGEFSFLLVVNGFIVGILVICSRLDIRVLVFEFFVLIIVEMDVVRFWMSNIKFCFDVLLFFCFLKRLLR